MPASSLGRQSGARFAGRVAVVTGGGAGIGAATAARLADEGAAVVVTDVTDAGSMTCSRITQAGGTAAFVQADAAEEGAWSTVMDAAHEFGPVSALVSNAARIEVSPAHETSYESWERQLNVSLTGAFLGVRAALSDLRAQRGSIVATSSVHALFGLPGHPAYAAAKGGLTALCRQLAVEYGPEVRVNTVLPGPIFTAAWDRVPEADRLRSVEQTVAGRFGAPEEVASAIAFLASGEASFITGASLVVDGGWSIVKASA
ncbi:SDR family NAD(P)-dependent oxidoreductase [Streptomyces tubercidicus]|uniref:SDR family NAD(P)-dependent oxidoreductase n=1 Tax=Streptomyces tubercidicus TaxID=47759 RepID=UPI003467E714